MNKHPWVELGDYQLNYGSACDIPTLRPTWELETNLLAPLTAEPLQQPLRLGVHIHSFYPDTTSQLLDTLRASLPSFDLLISTDSTAKQRLLQSEIRKSQYSEVINNSEVLVTENRGRNIAPLLLQAIPSFADHDLVLHLHTKKTVHQEFGQKWRKELLCSVLGDALNASSLLHAFQADHKLGLIMPMTSPSIRPFLNWGANFEIARLIVNKELPGKHLSAMAPLIFPHGMMFWFRPQALAGMSSAAQNLMPFPPEPLRDDGTTLHALERLTAHFCEAEGYRWALCGPNEAHPVHPNDSPATRSTSPSGGNLSVWQEQTSHYLGLVGQLAEAKRKGDLNELIINKALEGKKQQCSAIRREAEQRLSTIRLLEDRIQWLENELHALKQSTSWKLTGPLRRLRRKLGSGEQT